MVIEFKLTKKNRNAKSSLQEAINQIKKKNYGIAAFHDYKLYRVAMVISSTERAILPNFYQEVL